MTTATAPGGTRPRAVTSEEIATLERDGVVCLRGMFDADWVEHLRAAVEKNIAAPSRMVLDIGRGGTGKFFGDTFVWQHVPDFRAFVLDSPAAAIVAQITRSAKVNLLFDQILVKEPGTSTETLWHHDAPYWPVKGRKVVTLWLALDRVDAANGAVEYVRGSHLWGKEFKPRSFTGDARYTIDLPEVPDIDAERDRHDFVMYELEPGDCTIHYGLTLHGAPGNSTADRRRRAYVTRWCGDDVVYDPRPGRQPMLYDPDIAPGGPLDCALFPVVWPR